MPIDKGVKKNIKKAIYWLTKAVNQGNTRALGILAYMYEHGDGVEKDCNFAFRLHRKRAALYDEYGEYAAGSAYDAYFDSERGSNSVQTKDQIEM